jgi:hypothetical protein
MEKDADKPVNAAATTKLSRVEWKHAAFQALWTTYLHLRAWGLPEYEELTPEDKAYFRGLVNKGRDALFAHIEDCKRAVLRGGLSGQVRDEWLAVIGLHDFDLVKGFPQAKRDRLGKLLDEMYPLLVRLDPDAQEEPGGAEPDQPIPKTPVYRRSGKIHKSPRVYAVWMEWQYGYGKCGHRAPNDRTVYEWLRAHARDLAAESGKRVIKVRTPETEYGESRLVEKEVGFGPRLPIAAEAAQAKRLDFETWARYLREARKIEGLPRQNARDKS